MPAHAAGGNFASALEPIAFKLFGYTVHWYGILLAAGCVAGMWTAGWRGQREGFSPDTISNLLFCVFVSGLLGAKLLYIVDHWNPRESSLGAALLQRSGLVFQGALIGAAVAAVIYLRIKKLPAWKMLDTLAPSIALGYFFGRLGCLSSGCCHGQVCDLGAYQSATGDLFSGGALVTGTHAPWLATVYTPGVGLSTILSTPVYPTQLYEAASSLLLYAFLEWLFRRKRFDGQVFLVYLTTYSALRFAVEFYRGDPTPRFFNDRLTQAQLLSGVLAVVSIALMWRQHRAHTRGSAAEPR